MVTTKRAVMLCLVASLVSMQAQGMFRRLAPKAKSLGEMCSFSNNQSKRKFFTNAWDNMSPDQKSKTVRNMIFGFTGAGAAHAGNWLSGCSDKTEFVQDVCKSAGAAFCGGPVGFVTYATAAFSYRALKKVHDKFYEIKK